MRMFRRTAASRDPAAGTDTVIAECPLPDEGILKNVWLECHAMNTAETVLAARISSLGGYVVPVPEPGAALNVDTLWDEVIPKDVAFGVSTVDYDEVGSAVAAAEYEVGIATPGEIFDLGSSPREIFRRNMLTSLANSHAIDSVNSLYFPTIAFKSHVKSNVRAKRPSMVLFGWSTPSIQTTITVNVTPTVGEWSTIKYITQALSQAFIHLLGFVEAGAETPYDTIAAILVDFLEPAAMEETAGAWDNAGTWTIWCLATFEIEVPGDFQQHVLTSG